MADWLPTLPLTDPIPIFLLVLLIILCAPLLNRIRIPHIIGLILAGMALGPFALNVLDNDASFELFGKVGILYIMFLAGLEIDLNTFRRNSAKGVVFGVFTFLIPLIIGVLSSIYLLGFDWLTALLLSSVYASHTLIAYPVASKMGVAKSRAVSIGVAGTIVAVTISLFLLAVVVALHGGHSDWVYWLKFVGSTLLFAAIVFFVLPKIARLFLRRVSDNVAQYIFVLAVVFFASLLAEAAGLEGILGAFFAGLMLNRLVPSVSPLMNRIEFVGNAIFIPFFLISIGMMIDLGAFAHSFDGLIVALIMTAVVLFSKWLAAFVTQKTFRMRNSEGQLLFGLSVGHAAVTLAVVMIGFRLGMFDENVLNGSVLMILFTCAASTIVTEKGARKIATEELSVETTAQKLGAERVLIPLSKEETVRQLIDLGTLLKPAADKKALYAINVHSGESDEVRSQKLLEQAAALASATDNRLTTISKSGVNIANCIIESVAEHGITDILLNEHKKSSFVDTFFGSNIEQLIKECSENIFVCSSNKPVSTVRRIVVAVPEKAELEIGFGLWLDRIKNIAINLSIPIMFFVNNTTREILKTRCEQYKGLQVKFSELASWEDFLMVTKAVRSSDSVIIIAARRRTLSYHPLFEKLPYYLTKYFTNNNFAIVFPKQATMTEKTGELFNPLHV